MPILEVYLLVMIIIGLWIFGVVPTIRSIFKSYVTVLLRNAMKEKMPQHEKKRLQKMHRNTVNIISHANYREFMALLSIKQDIRTVHNGNSSINEQQLCTASRKYLNDAANAIMVCLYVCTIKGFLHFFCFMVRYIVTAKMPAFSKVVAQPVAILLFLVTSFSAMYQDTPEAVFSAGTTSLMVRR